jgi:hypothetical protein
MGETEVEAKTRPLFGGRVFQGFSAENGEGAAAKCPEGIFSRKPSNYFSDALMEEKFVLSVEPSPLTATMIARLIPEAIRPYSIAVAAV